MRAYPSAAPVQTPKHRQDRAHFWTLVERFDERQPVVPGLAKQTSIPAASAVLITASAPVILLPPS
jgi:hypothetical protein